MDVAQSSDPWWHSLPAVLAADPTDACGVCGISRDRHEAVGCQTPADWRILAYVGTYDRIPDGQWNVALGDGPAEDHRDPDGRNIWWIKKCGSGHALSPENTKDNVCLACWRKQQGDSD